MADEWEVRVTLLRNGIEVETFDAFGDSPERAMWNSSTDLERWAMRESLSGQ